MIQIDRDFSTVEAPRLHLALVLAFGLTGVFMASSAFAVPKGPGGQTCKSSGTTTVNGKEEGTGKAMKCTADYCKYDECETSGPNIGKCYEKTSYSNVRDCKAAAQSTNPKFHVPPGQLAPLTVQPSPPPASPRQPMAPLGGVMRRGMDGETPSMSAQPDPGTAK